MDPHETGIAAPKHAGNKPDKKRQKQKKYKERLEQWGFHVQWNTMFMFILHRDGSSSA